MSQLIATFGVLWALGVVVVLMVVGIGWPLMALSVTLNIRKIARHLEHISNTAEATPGYVRTGPLNMR